MQEEMRIGVWALCGVLALLLGSIAWALPDAFSERTAGVPPDYSSVAPIRQANQTAQEVPLSNNTVVWENFSTGLGPYSSPWGQFGFSYAFGGRLTLTGGAIDNNSNRSGHVLLYAPSYSDLNLTGFSQTLTLQFPNPLGINQTVTLASLDLELDVPYLGSFTWEPASIAIEFTMELAGDSNVTGCGTGAGPITWDGGASYPIDACASDTRPGDTVVSSLSDLRFEWAIGVVATASIPLIYTYTDWIVPMTVVASLPAATPDVLAIYQVVPPPIISDVFASPSNVQYGDWMDFGGQGSGGAGNLTYDYSETPGYNCPSTGSESAGCQATNTGTWNLTVCATDQLGARACGSAEYTVQPPQPFNQTPMLEALGVAGGALAVVTVGPKVKEWVRDR